MKRILRNVLPRFLWKQLSAVKCWIVGTIASKVARAILMHLNASELQRTVEGAGYCVARKEDCYSPLQSVSALRKNRARWDRPSSLHGIDYDFDKMKSLLSELVEHYAGEFSVYPPYETLQTIGFGPGYTAVDALTLYMLVRHVKPRRYVEVGSGLSTYYASLAAEKNAAEGFPVKITCIEPCPYDKLYSIENISIIRNEVQSVEPSLFRSLEANDMLFIDSSHVVRIDGDVPYLLLEILPVLAPGVVIHVHDVPFPYNTPYPADQWIFDQAWPMFWNEAMVLQAFLCYNSVFDMLLSTPLIRHLDEAFLKRHIPNYQSVEQNPNTFSSMWLRKSAVCVDSRLHTLTEPSALQNAHVVAGEKTLAP